MRNAILRKLGMIDSDDDNDSDIRDPQLKVLFSAISRGDVAAVETLVKLNMSLVSVGMLWVLM